MSRSLRTKTPTFRFNRNEDDLLEEVIEDNEATDLVKEDINDATNASSNGAQDMKDNTPFTDPLSQTPTKSSVKEFITSRLNKTKSLDEENGKEWLSANTSNWFHDIKGRIKEKIEEKKREKELKHLVNDESKSFEHNDVHNKHLSESLNDSLHIKSESIDENEKQLDLNISHNLTADYENDLDVSVGSPLAESEELELPSDDLFGSRITRSQSTNSSILSDNTMTINERNVIIETQQQLWSYSQMYYLIAMGFALIAFLIALSSPLPSFINGLLLGFFITLLLFSVLMVFIVSKFLIRKSIPIRDLKKSETIDSNRSDEDIYKGWMYEFVGNYSDRDSGFKTQMIYVRLQGLSLRLSKPKQDIRKLKLNSTSLPVFISQRIFDLSKMSHKAVYLLLPKSVKNQKKYIWSKKYPICLELEDYKTQNIIKLVFFIRNCREKEEWFWRFRATINSIINSNLNKEEKDISVFPGLPTQKPSGDLNSSEVEHLPRTHSLDLGSIHSGASFSSSSSSPISPTKELQILSKQIDYHMFMKTILNLKLSQSSSLSWFNALIGRICFDVLNEQFWSTYIATKIQRKLRRLRLPYFMESLTITEIDLGNTLPKFNDVPKPPVVDKRGLWIDFDITYSGGFTMTLETKLNLMKLKEQGTGSQEMRSFNSDIDISDNESDSIMTSSDEEQEENASDVDPDDANTNKKQQKILKFVDKIASSQYFQKATENKYIKRAMEGVSKTALILTVQIQTLNGTLAINIPEPPTDRLWYGFRGNPDLVLSARPKLGEHEVNIHQVTDIIERKLRAEFAKVLVMPNMDDLVIPVLMTNIDQFVTVVP